MRTRFQIRVLSLFVFALPALVHAQDKFRIEEIGLQGRFSYGAPTAIRVHIPALPSSQTIRLEFTVESRPSFEHAGPFRADRFQVQVQMTAGQSRTVEVPVLFNGALFENLQLQAWDSAGRMIGEAGQGFKAFERGLAAPSIAIYCGDQRDCLEAQAQLTPPAPSDDAQNFGDRVQFVMLKDLRQNWWDYERVTYLILAGPISAMSAERLNAAEEYARSGGNLVLVEQQMEDEAFLAAYRKGGFTPAFTALGHGRLYRVASLKGGNLSEIAKTLRKELSKGPIPDYFNQSALSNLIGNFGIQFSFPKLPWILTWLVVYILTIGLLNFVILRRMRRLEWGWLTVCATAVVFSLGVYFAGSSSRPETSTLDSVKVFWMDEHSPQAFEDLGLRVSSPVRRDLHVATNEDVVVTTSSGWSHESPLLNLGSAVTGKAGTQPGMVIRLNSPLEMAFPMLRWSFKDFYMQGFRNFPGTVHRTPGMHLKNDTGRAFKDGMYLDFGAHKAYPISSFGAGEEINLSDLPGQEIKGDYRFYSYGSPLSTPQAGQEGFLAKRFHDFDLGPGQCVFAGFDAAPEPGAQIVEGGAIHNSVALTIVVLDQP